ncbi:hypothetical protein HY969_00765 [Candidatus Kaiserbacteria bacterium]|nr:hypothetical protein [Candidatus Kaiserbacteria bacterium]
MIRNILLGLFAFVVIAGIIFWILNRGPQRIFASVRNFSFIGSGTTTGFALPWQPTTLVPLVEEEDLFAGGTEEVETRDVSKQLSDIERQYEDIIQGVNDVTTFGDPSPIFGSVRIAPAYSNTAGNTADSEFLVLEASLSNTAPTSLAGWSLQSALTGVRVSIPGAASPLRQGNVNSLVAATLDPGSVALVATGPSPVGASFRENICAGYLSDFQDFYPPLSLQCPTPASELPLTADNLKRYGDACFDYIERLPSCTFPTNVPTELSAECRSFLQNTLSYTGCAALHGNSLSFGTNTWRLFLRSDRPLWRDSHDAIRLLDAEGRTVDAYVY